MPLDHTLSTAADGASAAEWADLGLLAGRPIDAATHCDTRADRVSHRHTVQFYGDDAFLLHGLSRVIGTALGAGDAGVVIARKAHRDGLAEQLKARGVDVGPAATQGRYVALDAAETLARFMVDGWPDPARFAAVVGGTIARASAVSGLAGVSAYGEMVALLWTEGRSEAAIRLEQLWNELARAQAFDLQCAYPLELFSQSLDGDALGRVCAEHGRVIPAEDYMALASDDDRLRAVALLQQKARALETEIDRRRQIEQTLRETNDELRRAVATRDEFMSIAAHELKTPITSLRGFAQLLLRDLRRRQDIPPDRVMTALETIERQTERLRDLVTHLLDSAQIEAGKLRITPVQTDLAAFVRAALARRGTEAGRALLYDGPEQLDAAIDPIRFEQVIANLIDNAIKYSPDGGDITVALRSDADSIRLSVTDPGIGIPPDQRQKVFERFHQAHGQDHLSGMGLGLFITREIVELHGGSVRVEQPERPGTRFVVTLPPSTADPADRKPGVGRV